MIVVENKARRGRPRAFDRGAALEQAMRAFWATGFEGTSMPRLTEAMGISAQSLYAAFGSKEALYREAIELYRETVGAFPARAFAGETDALDAVARLLREAAVTFSQSAAMLGCMITTAPSGAADEGLPGLGRALRRHGVEAVAARLRLGVEGGQVRRDADCAAWARFVVGVLQGLSVQARDGASVEDLLSSAEIAASAVRALRP